MSSTSTEVEAAEVKQAHSKVVSLIKEGKISLAQVLKALRPDEPKALPVPAKAPLPAVITDKQRKALERLPEVYGKVVPTERRLLDDGEITALGQERDTLDDLAKMAKTRIENIRTTVFNHFDVEVEAALGEDGEVPPRDKDGHYIAQGEVSAPEIDGRFTRETREGSATLTVEALLEVEKQGLITHEQFLAATSQVRVINEAGMLDIIKKDPTFLRALAVATQPGAPSASHYYRPKRT